MIQKLLTNFTGPRDQNPTFSSPCFQFWALSWLPFLAFSGIGQPLGWFDFLGSCKANSNRQFHIASQDTPRSMVCKDIHFALESTQLYVDSLVKNQWEKWAIVNCTDHPSWLQLPLWQSICSTNHHFCSTVVSEDIRFGVSPDFSKDCFARHKFACLENMFKGCMLGHMLMWHSCHRKISTIGSPIQCGRRGDQSKELSPKRVKLPLSSSCFAGVGTRMSKEVRIKG